MRDCRKFIHYEFSPPFASSESSVSELESPENRKDIFMKKFIKKKMRASRTQSMTEECLSSPSSVSSSQSLTMKKRGRPVKSKSTDCKEEISILDEDSNASTDNFDEKKRKRGRPPKKKLSQEDNSKMTVSDMAENLSQNQISPITREKLVFPLSSPNTEERKAKLISQQRESFMLRRNSEDSRKARKAKKIARSKSIDVSHNLEPAKIENLDELKRKMNDIDFNKLPVSTQENTELSPVTEDLTKKNTDFNQLLLTNAEQDPTDSASKTLDANILKVNHSIFYIKLCVVKYLNVETQMKSLTLSPFYLVKTKIY